MNRFQSMAFDAPVTAPDGYGGQETTWAETHTCRAEMIYHKGGEEVESARLSGAKVFKVKIRQCTLARQITSSWRVRDVRRTEEYNIREVDAISDRQFIYIVAESGVAV